MQWLFIIFSQAFIQNNTIYWVKVKNIRANTMIDVIINKVRDRVYQKLCSSSKYSISRVDWLSTLRIKYGFIVIYFIQKKYTDKVLAHN